MARFLSQTRSIKSENFIHHKLISSFIHLTSVMPGIKEVKHFTETASSDNKSQDLHDDPI